MNSRILITSVLITSLRMLHKSSQNSLGGALITATSFVAISTLAALWKKPLREYVQRSTDRINASSKMDCQTTKFFSRLKTLLHIHHIKNNQSLSENEKQKNIDHFMRMDRFYCEMADRSHNYVMDAGNKKMRNFEKNVIPAPFNLIYDLCGAANLKR